MKLFIRFLLILLCVVVFSLLKINKVQASTIFEDDFNSYSEGSFPTKWSEFDNPGESKCNNSPWKINSGRVGVSIINQGSCVVNIVPNDIEWPNLVSEFIFEVDMYFKQGSDHNLAYKVFPDTNSLVELHFINGDFGISHWGGSIIYDKPLDYYPNKEDKYHLKIVVRNTNLKVYIDDQLAKELEITYLLPAGKIGLRVGTGADPNSETWFDNVKVTTIEEDSVLSVPLLKQTDPLWINDLYDSANLWSTGATSIGRWGCALTSAAMILQYNNINKLPNNQTLTPSTLNDWLKSEPDGYIRNGFINWLAISRMTKISKANNLGFLFDALEYKRVSGQHNDLLTIDINNKVPAILEEPGHFIVAKGISGNTFLINDPYYNRLLLNDYGNLYNSYGKYVPSNTDLSYLMFVVDSTVGIALKDSQGNSVGEVYTENSIADPLNIFANTVGSLKIVSFSEPPTDKYTIIISSAGSLKYFLQGYLYDVDGGVKILEKRDVLSQNDNDSFSITFSKNNNQDTSLQQSVTLITLRNDLNALYSLSLIKKAFYKHMKEKINEIEKKYNKEHKNVTKKLNELAKEIKKEKKLDPYAKEVLLNDIQALIGSLSLSSKFLGYSHKDREEE